jgi:polyisoprenoid-binding protein YceI
VNTGDEKRDGHLRSADFLDAQTHPEIVFKSRKVTPKGKNEFVVDGDLTIRGTTKPVVVNVELVGIGKDPRAGQRAGFDAKFSFDRTQWGLTWNMPVPSGVLVGEKISIEANIAATPQVKSEAIAASAAARRRAWKREIASSPSARRRVRRGSFSRTIRRI